MLNVFSTLKELENQTIEEKMEILRALGQKMLGGRGEYFRKIKRAGQGFKLLRERTLMEQMKATQSALTYTTKHTRRLYRLMYQASIREIRGKSNQRSLAFPELPISPTGEMPPTLGPDFDAVIIQWTPLKFLLPAKAIRTKGIATQRHSEGLISKLYFKLVAYYAVPENWDMEKLTFYIGQIKPESTYQDVAVFLEPLKKDIIQLTQEFVPFKFGSPSLAKDAVQDEDVYDDAMDMESFDDQVRTLYWYDFIYLGLELFLSKYFFTLISATESQHAVRYLASLFEPLITKIVEVRSVFMGSFETDKTKKPYINSYKKLLHASGLRPRMKQVSLKKGLYECYEYTTYLLEETSLNIDLKEVPGEDSDWARFIREHILPDNTLLESSVSAFQTVGEQKEEEKAPATVVPEVVGSKNGYVLLQIMNTLIRCSESKKNAGEKISERFKQRVEADMTIADKRIKELHRKADRKLIQMKRKVTKLRRMEQAESADIYEADIEKFKKRIETMASTIHSDAEMELAVRKRRLQSFLQHATENDDSGFGLTSSYILQLIDQLDPDLQFKKHITKFVSKSIQENYVKEYEPFYKNVFDILQPSAQEKVIMIQSLEKTGGPDGVKLSLTKEEQQQVNAMLLMLRKKIKQSQPDVFDAKIILMTLAIPLNDLFRISIDNKSLQMMLRLKVTSPMTPKPSVLRAVTIKALFVLNLVTNPVPKHSLLLSSRGHVRDPLHAINNGLLNKLLVALD